MPAKIPSRREKKTLPPEAIPQSVPPPKFVGPKPPNPPSPPPPPTPPPQNKYKTPPSPSGAFPSGRAPLSPPLFSPPPPPPPPLSPPPPC